MATSLLGSHPVPSWAAVIGQDAGNARLVARPPLRSEAIAQAYDLTLRFGDKGIVVKETRPGDRLPTRCPELHIVGHGAFCLGAEENWLSSEAEAAAFWKRLGDYLVSQEYAARRRKWPAGRWLSHGPTALKAQLEAEAIADDYGWRDAYDNAIENDQGWIAIAVKHGTSAPGSCPCVSSHAGPQCPNRKAVAKIVGVERRRRDAEAKHFDALAALGVECCGRIDGCPLGTKVSDVGYR